MGSRFRFLHCWISELWGRISEVLPGNGKTGISKVAVWEANPPYKVKV